MLSKESLQNTTVIAIVGALGLGLVSWSGVHLYIYFCAHPGVLGFLQSLVTMDSSPCQALFGLIAHSQMMYGVTIASLVCAIISFLGSCCAVDSPQCIPCQPCKKSEKTS